MDPFYELLAIIAVFYAAECIVFVWRDAIIFSSWLRPHLRFSYGHKLPTLMNFGLFLSAPLPPLGRQFLTGMWPISLSPTGIALTSVQHPSQLGFAQDQVQFIAYDEVRQAQFDGKHLLINGLRIARCASDPAARALRDLVNQLRPLGEHEREIVLGKAISNSLNESDVARILSTIRGRCSVLKWAGNALFMMVFGVTPITIYLGGLAQNWMWLLAAMILVWLYAIVSYYRVHRSVFPNEKAERRRQLFMLVLTPLTAIRVQDLFTRNVFAAHHPLAVAQATCSPATFRALAGDMIRDLAHPLPLAASADSRATETCNWMRERLRADCERLIRRAGVEPGSLLGAPERMDAHSAWYCPRCLCQYVRSDAKCGQCDVDLAPLATSSTIEKSGKIDGDSPLGLARLPLSQDGRAETGVVP